MQNEVISYLCLNLMEIRKDGPSKYFNFTS